MINLAFLLGPILGAWPLCIAWVVVCLSVAVSQWQTQFKYASFSLQGLHCVVKQSFS